MAIANWQLPFLFIFDSMWKYISILSIALISYSCKSAFQKQLNQADELTIHFYNNAHADSVIKILRTNNKDAIQNLSAFIDSKVIATDSCGHDGDIIFYKGTQVIQVVDFNLLDLKCRHFAFENNERQIHTSMNNQAADFLLSLWSGKSY